MLRLEGIDEVVLQKAMEREEKINDEDVELSFRARLMIHHRKTKCYPVYVFTCMDGEVVDV